MFPPAVASHDLNVKLFFLFDFAQCAQWMEVTGSNTEACTDFGTGAAGCQARADGMRAVLLIWHVVSKLVSIVPTYHRFDRQFFQVRHFRLFFVWFVVTELCDGTMR